MGTSFFQLSCTQTNQRKQISFAMTVQKNFLRNFSFCKSFPSLTYQSQSIMVVSLHYIMVTHTHTHTHLWLKHESLGHIKQVKFKIFFTQLMLNSRYRQVEGNCDLSDESQKMGLVIKGIHMHQSKVKMFFKFTKKSLILKI